jgi:hypothetical protein
VLALAAALVATPGLAVEVPGSGGRLVAGGYLAGLAVAPTAGGSRQRPGTLLDLHLDGAASRWLRGRLELRGRVGGPYEGGHQGVFNLVHAFQNTTPSLEVSEAYVDVLLERADVRAGLQRIAWGRLDGVPPTDVINPRDYHDPIVEDFEERKIGIPAVLGTYYPPDVPRLRLQGLRATLAYLPLAVPSRLALIEERWFPPSVVVASPLVLPRSLAEQLFMLDQRIVIPITFRTRNDRPPLRLDAGGVALRMGGTWRETDWDVYHYTGPETGPDADLDSTLFLPRRQPVPGVLRLRSDAELRQTHDGIHMTGADCAAAVGPVTLRAEVAFFQNKPYLRLARDLISPAALRMLPTRAILRQLQRTGSARVPLGDLFVESDSMEWGLGVDSVIRGFVPLLQLNQIVLFDAVPRLLIADPETRVSVSLRKPFLADRLELELRGTYAVERGGWFFLPRLSYVVRDDLHLRLGYLAIGGPRTSTFGQFGDNDEVVLEGRHTF